MVHRNPPRKIDIAGEVAAVVFGQVRANSKVSLERRNLPRLAQVRMDTSVHHLIDNDGNTDPPDES